MIKFFQILIILFSPFSLLSQISIPFEIIEHRIVVDVEINSNKYKFALDFQHNSVLSQEIVEKNTLQIVNNDWYAIQNGDSVISNQVLIEDFQLGILKYKKQEFTAIDFTALAESLPVDGFLSYDFFEDYVLQIDFPQREMKLHPKGYLPKISAIRVNLKFSKKIPYSLVEINGKSEWMALDFSATTALKFHKDYPQAKLQQVFAMKQTDLSMQKPLKDYDFFIQKLKWGLLEKKGVPAQIAKNTPAYMYNSKIIGGIGSPFFMGSIIFLDFDRSSLWINQ